MIRPIVFFCLTVCLYQYSVQAQDSGIHFPDQTVASFHALPTEPEHLNILRSKHPSILTVNTTLFEERQVIDFEKREVSFERVDKVYGFPVWQYRYAELDDYLQDRQRFALFNAWYGSFLSTMKSTQGKLNGLNSLQWELPVQYPSWAQRILGKEPPKLSISGFEKIIVSYDNEKTDLPSSNYNMQATNGIKFDQQNQFTITGSVGKLIKMDIKGSTNQGIDASVGNPLKDFKIDYKGDGNELEDEVVQEVTAGYTNFDMPGTQLSGFSESHEGLFGVKVVGKLGPLALTGIVSNEEGEPQGTTLHPSGSGDSKSSISEKDFVPNKIFFLDTIYRNLYLGKKTKAPTVNKLQVWLSNTAVVNEDVSTNPNRGQNNYKKAGHGQTTYKLLVETRDYFVNKVAGWIRFDSVRIADADLVGIYLETSDTTLIPKRGVNLLDPLRDTTKDITIGLWTLKNPSQLPSDSTFPLMWRNVYNLPGGFDPVKFQLRITRALPADTSQEKNTGGRFFSAILGLSDEAGKPLVGTSTIYDVDHSLIILPVWTDSAYRGNQPFANPALGDNNSIMYTQNSVDFADAGKTPIKFQMTMTGSQRKTSFQLGYGSIMANTEVLKVNGTILHKPDDYVIDYQTGQIDLTSKQAQTADKIDVIYQSEALFVPKQKVFLGLHGETKIPFGNNSILGASILYQDASTTDIIPKLNQEPYSKLLLDLNAKLDFDPEWMTKAVNMLPLVSTDAKSSVAVEAEIAHSRTNPNTSAGNAAYVDDFESSKVTYALGLSQSSWYQASPPPDSNGTPSDLLISPPAWLQYWYAPVSENQPKKSDIFKQPAKLNQTVTDQLEPVFNFTCQPAPAKYGLDARYKNPWAGIMTYLPNGNRNRTNDKYLEFWAKNPSGGRLNIDMGLVSEDLSLDGGPPNNQPDKEDKNLTGILVDSLNVGLDGQSDQDEKYLIPNANQTGWDTLGYGNDTLPYPHDPHKDNYQTYRSDGSYVNNYPYVNGTEKDNLLNSEDMTGEGWSTQESYFRRYIDFDSTSSTNFMAGNANNYKVPDSISTATANSGWHLYRIPMNDIKTGYCKVNGQPQWTNIKFVRMWWSNLSGNNKTQLNTMQFARIQLVGNQWIEETDSSADSLQNTKLHVSTLNTEENIGQYTPPPSMTIQKDDYGNYYRESSLLLSFDSLAPGETFKLRRSMNSQAINLSSYQDLSILVNSDQDRNDLWYFLRFGADDSTYYECRMKMNAGFASRASRWMQMPVKLMDISDLKRTYQNRHGDTARIDTSETLANGIVLSIKSPSHRTPSFSAVTWMGMGVYRDSTNMGVPFVPGNVWVDELKVTGVRELNGFAGRLSLTTKWADFMNLSMGMDYRDGSFRTMTDNNMALQNSTMSAQFSIDWKLDKFMPVAWGVNLPLGTSVQDQLTRPQLMSSSDIYLTSSDGTPDNLGNMYKDVFYMILGQHNPDEPTLSGHYQTTTLSRRWWTGYSKSVASKNPFVNMMLDRISLDNVSYSLTASQVHRGETASPDSDKMDIDTQQTYHATFKYDLSPKPAPSWTKWKPFEKTKLSWLSDRVKGYEFSLLPTTLTFDLAEINYSRQNSSRAEDSMETRVKRLTIDHRMNLLYDPINILNLSYNLSIDRNFDNDVTNLDMSKDFGNFFGDKIARMDPEWREYGFLWGERTRTQNGTIRFDPSFLDWLSHSVDYTTAYTHTLTGQTSDTNAFDLKTDGTFHLASTMNFASLFKQFSGGFANVKAMATTFSSIQKAMESMALNSITFDYNARSSVQNFGVKPCELNGVNSAQQTISGKQFFEYQAGLSGRTGKDIMNIFTGEMNDNSFGGMKFRTVQLTKPDQRTADRSFSIKTSFNLPAPLDVQFSTISLGWSKSVRLTTDTSSRDTTQTFPDLTIGARTGMLNKLPIVMTNFQSLQCNSNFNMNKKSQNTITSSQTNNMKSTAMNFSPLVGLDGTLKKWPVKVNYVHNLSVKTDENSANQNVTSTLTNDDKVGAQYEIQKATFGKEDFKFLFWKIPVKGRIVTGLDVTRSSTEVQMGTSVNNLAKTSANSSLAISPNASYDFTDNITGATKYEYSQKKGDSQTLTSNIFSLSVEIRF